MPLFFDVPTSVISGLTAYALMVGSATGTASFISDVAVGQVLVSGGVSAVPAFSASPSLTSLTLSSLTAGRVPLVSTAGLFADSSQFAYLTTGGQTYVDINAGGMVGALNVKALTNIPRTLIVGGISIGTTSFTSTLVDFSTTHRGDGANSANDTSDIFAISHTTWSNNASAALTASGAVLSVTNVNTISTGSVTDSRPVIKAVQDTNSTGDIHSGFVGATKVWSVNNKGVEVLGNGSTAPSSAVDSAKLYAKDISAGNCTLGIYVERAVAGDIAVASTHSLDIFVNGSQYKIPLVFVA